MYYDHSTCMYHDHDTSMYYYHSTCMYYGHKTCMYYDHSTCMYYDSMRMFLSADIDLQSEFLVELCACFEKHLSHIKNSCRHYSTNRLPMISNHSIYGCFAVVGHEFRDWR